MQTADCKNIRELFSQLKLLVRELLMIRDLGIKYQTLGIINNDFYIEFNELKGLIDQTIHRLEHLTGLEIVRNLKLKEQYEEQRRSLTELGILKELSDGNWGIIGIDRIEYPFPKYKDIVRRIIAKRNLLIEKEGLDFHKLLIVPFAMSLEEFRIILIDSLVRYAQQNRLNDQAGHPLKLIEGLPFNNGLYPYKFDDQGDKTGKIIYYPKDHITVANSSSNLNHGGFTKMDLLTGVDMRGNDTTFSIDGYNILIVQDNLMAKADHEQSKLIPTPGNYQTKLNRNSEYRGEVGLTIEDWITYFLTTLHQTSRAIDSNSLFVDDFCGSWLLASYQLSQEGEPDKYGYIFEAWGDATSISLARQFQVSIQPTPVNKIASRRSPRLAIMI